MNLWCASFWSLTFFSCFVPGLAFESYAALYENGDIISLARQSAKKGDLQRIGHILNGEEGDLQRGLEILSVSLIGAIEGGQRDIIEYIRGRVQLFESYLFQEVVYQASVEDNSVVLFYLHDHALVQFTSYYVDILIQYGGGKVAEFILASCIYYPTNKYKLLWKACKLDNVRMVSYLASQNYDLAYLDNMAVFSCFEREYMSYQLISPNVFTFLLESAPNLGKQDLVDALHLKKAHLKSGYGARLDDELLWLLFHKLGWEAYTLVKSHPELNSAGESVFLGHIIPNYDCETWETWQTVDRKLDEFVMENLLDLMQLNHDCSIENAIEVMLERFKDPELTAQFKAIHRSLSPHQLYRLIRVLAAGFSNNDIRLYLGLPEISLSLYFAPTTASEPEEAQAYIEKPAKVKGNFKKWLGRTILHRK